MDNYQAITADNDQSVFDGMTETIPLDPREEWSLREEVTSLREDVTALKEALAPLAPFIEQLPELAAKIDPLLEGLKKSPVLKMLGVSL